jgi:hypothetical protein
MIMKILQVQDHLHQLVREKDQKNLELSNNQYQVNQNDTTRGFFNSIVKLF